MFSILSTAHELQRRGRHSAFVEQLSPLRIVREGAQHAHSRRRCTPLNMSNFICSNKHRHLPPPNHAVIPSPSVRSKIGTISSLRSPSRRLSSSASISAIYVRPSPGSSPSAASMSPCTSVMRNTAAATTSKRSRMSSLGVPSGASGVYATWRTTMCVRPRAGARWRPSARASVVLFAAEGWSRQRAQSRSRAAESVGAGEAERAASRLRSAARSRQGVLCRSQTLECMRTRDGTHLWSFQFAFWHSFELLRIH